MAINHHVTRSEKPLPRKPFDSDPRYVYLTPRQMVEHFGLSKSYWYRRRKTNTGPAFVPAGGRKILYRLDIVQAWFDAQFVQGFDDPHYLTLKEKHRVTNKNKRNTFESKPKKGIVSVIRGEVSVVRNPVGPAPATRPKIFRFLNAVEASHERATASEAARTRVQFARAM